MINIKAPVIPFPASCLLVIAGILVARPSPDQLPAILVASFVPLLLGLIATVALVVTE